MILGVMTRVALGLSGRPLKASGFVVISYALVSVAAFTRVFGPWLAPNYYTLVLTASITAWASAFAIFLAAYIPILLRPRLDGQAG